MAKDRAPLDPVEVQEIVIDNTPHPDPGAAPQTQLKSLGIIDSTQAGIHKAGIQGDIGKKGWTIKQSDIKSSPTTTIAACRDSVLINAK